MKTLLWLDDIRDPYSSEFEDFLVFSPVSPPYNVHWVKSYAEFKNWIQYWGLPDGIAFDHDLGDNPELRVALGIGDWFNMEENREYTGYDCAKWLVDYCIDNKKTLPAFNSHSANPVGKENILSLLNNFKKNETNQRNM